MKGRETGSTGGAVKETPRKRQKDSAASERENEAHSPKGTPAEMRNYKLKQYLTRAGSVPQCVCVQLSLTDLRTHQRPRD